MNPGTLSTDIVGSRSYAVVLGLLIAVVFSAVTALAQRGVTGPVSATPRAIAPIDVTGNWVAVITEDWRVRMITPPRGDFLSIPLNDAGIETALAWDPEADTANGLECKAFGAAAIMRMPTRIRIDWTDDDTLRFDFDYGQQSRLAHFDPTTPTGERSWQGQALAEWIDVETARNAAPEVRIGELVDPDEDGSAGLGTPRVRSPQRGGLRLVTTNLLPQYQRQNGIPVSENAVVTNTMDIVAGPGGEDWLIVTTQIEDPQYMTAVRKTSVQFKREPDDSNWNPVPCAVELPPVPRIPVQR